MVKFIGGGSASPKKADKVRAGTCKIKYCRLSEKRFNHILKTGECMSPDEPHKGM